MNVLLEKLGVRYPILQAPMAGGPDTPELAAVVSEAGGLGAIGCGYLSPAQIETRVAELRKKTSRPFSVNLFVRESSSDDPAAATRVRPVLDAFRAELGLSGPAATAPEVPSYPEQLEAVIRIRPHVFSFTFGAPTSAQLSRLREAGIVVVGTATSLEEAEALANLGVDAICAQGSEAGGHRGTFLGRAEDALIGTLTLTRQIATRVAGPVIAAGGIMDGAGIRAALALGAQAVQLGTAFMLCPEAGTNAPHRAALRSDAARRTVITRAFSGRAARGIRNRFSDAFESVAAAPFPQQQQLSAELRTTATKQGRTDLMQLWAGQGAPLIREMPARELMRTLIAEGQLDDSPSK
jgi:nitronate monooxygenase